MKKGMSKKEAFDLVYKYNGVVKRTIDRLMTFHSNMNACDFAKASGTNTANIYMIVRRYKLKLSNRRDQNAHEWHNEQIRKNYVSKWDSTKTIRENALAFGISYQRAMNISREFNLNSEKSFQRTTIKKIERIKEYKNKGLNEAEISRIMGLTRERIRQLQHYHANKP